MDLKEEKARLCGFLMFLRDELRDHGKLVANKKIDEFSLLEHVEAMLDNMGAVDAVAEQRAKDKLEHLKWYRDRGRFVFPDMKPPEGYQP